MRYFISTFAAQVQIPGIWCFATALWGDCTSNMGSVLGLYPPRGEFWPQLHHLPAVTLDMSCYPPGPLTFLQQNENIGSEGFQELLFLL